jgi:SAM-dependent methyltransferase
MNIDFDDFYKAFENRFRGDRSIIRERLKVYQPVLDHLKQTQSDLIAADLGCGRGEWLEILSEQGFQATGVDLNPNMPDGLQLYNIEIQKMDVLEYLLTLENESLSLITGFHIVEHLEFNYLLKLIYECQRILKPGGILIMETPNPENIIVGSKNFYVDPTHIRPLPKELLSFIVEYCDFPEPTTLRLQSNVDLTKNAQKIGLSDVFNGASQDYAVVAQKNISIVNIASNQNTLNLSNTGNTIDELISVYEQKNEETSRREKLHIEQSLLEINKQLTDLRIKQNNQTITTKRIIAAVYKDIYRLIILTGRFLFKKDKLRK